MSVSAPPPPPPSPGGSVPAEVGDPGEDPYVYLAPFPFVRDGGAVGLRAGHLLVPEGLIGAHRPQLLSLPHDRVLHLTPALVNGAINHENRVKRCVYRAAVSSAAYLEIAELALAESEQNLALILAGIFPDSAEADAETDKQSDRSAASGEVEYKITDDARGRLRTLETRLLELKGTLNGVRAFAETAAYATEVHTVPELSLEDNATLHQFTHEPQNQRQIRPPGVDEHRAKVLLKAADAVAKIQAQDVADRTLASRRNKSGGGGGGGNRKNNKKKKGKSGGNGNKPEASTSSE